MKRTTHHSLSVHLIAVMLGNISCAYLFFDLRIDTQSYHFLSLQGIKKASVLITVND